MKPLHQISVTYLKGVGVALADSLKKIHIFTIQDLLFHLPIRYLDRTKHTPINTLIANNFAVIQGVVVSTNVLLGRKKTLLCRIDDTTGIIGLRFYYFSGYQLQQLSSGALIRCFGEVRRGASGLEIYHPEYHIVDSEESRELEPTLTPIYSTTEGLSQYKMRNLCQNALNFLRNNKGSLIEWLSLDLLQKFNLSSLQESLIFLHSPPVDQAYLLSETRHPYQRRLIFEELLAHCCSMKKVKKDMKKIKGFSIPYANGPSKQLIQQLTFDLTNAQVRVINEILKDMDKIEPMLRLIQGDVGSGKTIVAAFAAFQAVKAGYQVVIMAPTEILAEQHKQHFYKWFKPLNIEISYLIGKITGKKRSKVLLDIRTGISSITIGTHALFQKDVQFQKLGLIIVDEQHRFGVNQRLALKEKGVDFGKQPHQLIMTATPIPRTLAMSAYANIDFSIIDELPAGRVPVNTVLINDTRRDEVVKRLKTICLQGKQAYWVCTLIDESEVLESQAAEVTLEQLQKKLPELSVGLVHGRMKVEKKQLIIDDFKSGDIDLLVATTVIEVGIDVPNASLMIIENPERLGLAQLHQLRGRVGRSAIESYCVLLYHRPLSQQSFDRLKIMRSCNDGFVISEKDLQLRGPGEILGTKQTGLLNMKVANLMRDHDALKDAGLVSDVLFASEQEEVIDKIIERWIGNKYEYSSV